MGITKRDVEHVALLARLELAEEEKESFTRQLDRIIRHVDKLNELDTEGIPPTFHTLPELRCRLREDRVGEGLDREEALAGAPEREGDCFKVPPVIEDDRG